MALEILLRRQMGALRPIDALSEAQLLDLPQDAILKAVITRPVNVKFRRKFFALLAVLFPHQTYYPTLTKFRKAVEIALGFCEETKLPSGKIMVEATSIAFHKMGEEDFEALMTRFFELAETRILPGINRKDVEREWQEVMRGYDESGGADSHAGRAPAAESENAHGAGAGARDTLKS